MTQLPSPSPWSIASPPAGGALHAASSGLLHTLPPLRIVARGEGANIVGLVVMAEGAGFLIECIGSVQLIRSVGEVRAYAAFSALSAVRLLSLAIQPGVMLMMAIMAVMGFVNAGQSVIIESWLNAMVPNEGRGRALTLYVLVLGLLWALAIAGPRYRSSRRRQADDRGRLLCAGAGPVTAVWVGEPQLHAPVGVHFLRTIRTSPLGTLACLMIGLISLTFASIGSLYGLELGFTQDHIVVLMAAVALGVLFLQFPLGALSDKLDRRSMMLWLSLLLPAVCGLFLAIYATTPLWMLLILFSVFGGISEIFYPLGVAHAHDRATASEFVALSSNLLLVWALGGTIGPAIAATGVERFGAASFFGMPSSCRWPLPALRCGAACGSRRSAIAKTSSPIRRPRPPSTNGCRARMTVLRRSLQKGRHHEHGG